MSVGASTRTGQHGAGLGQGAADGIVRAAGLGAVRRRCVRLAVERILQQGGVGAARHQQQIADFAHRAEPGGGAGDVAHAGQHLGVALRRRSAETRPGDQGEIRPVVADDGHLLPAQLELVEQALGGGQLGAAAQHAVLQAEFGAARAQRGAVAPGNDDGLDACAHQQLEAVAVEGGKALELFALRAIKQVAGGEHAVHVEQQQSHIERGE